MKKIKKLLIANRGEIAVRIIKTAKKLGIKTIAIYSDADAIALHTKLADEAYYVGNSPASESYLKQDTIINIAIKSGADAIHPGYGFLSENAEFAELVHQNNLIFIGPDAEAIRVMGDKISSKDTVAKYNVPLIPGFTITSALSIEQIKDQVREIGYPVMVKASAGGGGKGMRIVNEESELEQLIERASSEALKSFGDETVFIEKYIIAPRHIEFQLLCDTHGNSIHLLERECSIQRRHQKVIEECPSPFLDEKLRASMGQTALAVAASCRYMGAGTVEFIVDRHGNYFFLEMNTRLQVEHPVTEEVTGVDIVAEQILIAEGKPLSYKQEDITPKGHAIELRVYAEDPLNNFLPDIGTLHYLKAPDENKHVRVDSGVQQHDEISIYYDPMIAKLITKGNNRNEAIHHMINAIKEYEVFGVMTTLPFGLFVLQHEKFISGSINTGFIQQYFTPSDITLPDNKDENISISTAAHHYYHLVHKKTTLIERQQSAWQLRKFFN